ncbi:MAG: hypothetical protein ACYC61_25300 [Isosphaeraceae bacterium]
MTIHPPAELEHFVHDEDRAGVSPSEDGATRLGEWDAPYASGAARPWSSSGASRPCP